MSSGVNCHAESQIILFQVVDSLRQLSSSRRSNLQTGLLGTLLSHALEQQKDEEEVKVASVRENNIHKS